MMLFARITLIYAIVALGLTVLLRDSTSVAGTSLLASGISLGALAKGGLWGLLALVAFAWWRSASSREFAERFLKTLVVLVLCCVFMASFSSMKTLLPLMATALGLSHFFADPFFANIDAALHFGTDPWVITHAATEALGLDNFINQSAYVYSLIWAIPALYLPAIMMLLGERDEKFTHFALLYAFSWIFLGNAVALAGYSAGPVYYDRIFGTVRFTDLTLALEAAQIEGSWFGGVQAFLWEAYTEMEQEAGSGISAFPSLHIATVTITALYLATFGRIAQWVGITLVVCMLFISVWVGYHYAIDGYASIVAVLAAHWALKRGRSPVLRTSAIPGE